MTSCLGDGDPVQAGHLQVQHGDVRAVPAGHREGLVAGGGLGHDLQVVLDASREASAVRMRFSSSASSTRITAPAFRW